MKIYFRNSPLNRTSLKRIDVINSIIGEYLSQSLTLTLRQLYYQLVTRMIIPNKQTEYSRLSRLLKEGRMCGLVDWDAIEDRVRNVQTPQSWNSEKELLTICSKIFQLPRLESQSIYIEVWVEKDALSGVLSRVTRPYQIPIMVNRGYSSASAMYDAYVRFMGAIRNGQSVKILYLGDHDPSGIDMVRDIEDRIREFFFKDMALAFFNFEIIPIALTSGQIQQYNPPPNPAKLTDPRAGEYVRNYGKTSWEVDALRPDVLHQILTDHILEYMDTDAFESIKEQEIEPRRRLSKLVDKWGGKAMNYLLRP